MSDAATTERPDARVMRMRGVIPYLSLDGQAGEAADFYARAFDARDHGRMPDPTKPDRLMHVQVEINGGALMMTDHRSEGEPGGSALSHGHLQLVVDDGKAWWDRAVGAGCTVAMPYERQPWGDEWGLLVDPFGIRWAILEPGPEQDG